VGLKSYFSGLKIQSKPSSFGDKLSRLVISLPLQINFFNVGGKPKGLSS
jgi:hypothetical protein